MNVDFSQLNTTELVVMLIVGLLLVVAGYRIKKIGFFLIWFLIGFTLMGQLMPIINDGFAAIRDSSLWQMLLPLAGGLLVGLMGFTIEKVCVGGIAFGLTMMVVSQYFGTEPQTLVIGAVVGAVAAGAAVMLMKPAIIVASSVAGSYMMTAGILTWASNMDPTVFYFPLLIGIGAIGSVIQFVSTRGE